MDINRHLNLLPFILILAGGLSLAGLWLGDAPADLALRVPILENEPLLAQDEGPFEGELLTFDGQPSQLPGAWPNFRGAALDAIARDDTPLERNGEGLETLWGVDLGEGYAGAAIRDGRVFVVDYDQDRKGDAVRCFSLDDGREIWRYFYPVKTKRQHGMSRTIPTVAEDYVITIGPKCHVVCLDVATGALRWMRDLVREDGTKVPQWYAGQCPLVEDDRLILGVGGTQALVMALDCNDGSVLWETPNLNGWQMTHSSLVPMDLDGRRTYVYCASGGVVGVSAADGRILWEHPHWYIKIANVPTPVVIDGERIFLCGGYRAGSLMLKLFGQGDLWGAEELFRLDHTVFGSEQQTPILYQGHLYGVRPDQQLVCLALDGNVKWTSSSAYKFGLGPYMIINDIFYLLDDEGHLTLAEANAEVFTPVTEAQVLTGHESWGPMAYASGRLIVRDMKRMVCLDIAAR